MSRCVIIAAGEIKDYSRVRDYLRSDDFFVICDGGLTHVAGLCIKPDLIVGDFDSCDTDLLKQWEKQCETVKLPREKDDTDTMYAARLAVERGFDEFLLLGAMGGRFDHAVANVSILLYLYEQGKKAVLVDDYSEMRICGKEPLFIEDTCSYFSVVTMFGDVSGVTIKNAKYPLENASLSSDFQLGVSNEVLPGKVAEVSVEHGRVLAVTVVE